MIGLGADQGEGDAVEGNRGSNIIRLLFIPYCRISRFLLRKSYDYKGNKADRKNFSVSESEKRHFLKLLYNSISLMCLDTALTVG